MENIKIEMIGAVEFDYPYLEVFWMDNTYPFLDIGISEQKELVSKFYVSKTEFELSVTEMDNITSTAKRFFKQALIDAKYNKNFKNE